jgi:hypothetical protein
MKLAVAVVLFLAASLGLAQDRPAPLGGIYNPTSTYSVAFAGTAPSSDIFSGLAEGRTLLMVAADWDHQVHQGRKTDYRWEVEILPFVSMSNPRQTSTTVITIPGQAVYTASTDQLLLAPCTSFTISGPYTVGPVGFPAGQGTLTYTQTCSTVWNYLGGVSPLGQRLSWRPGKRLQPYWITNAGFLAATRIVPMYGATKFNFTVESGGGIEWFLRDRRSVAFDVRYHHTSNGGRGDNNPGVDNIAFRASYRLGRR